MGMEEDHRRYTSGQLVKLVIKERCYTPDGFATVGTIGVQDMSSAEIFCEIDLQSFPSSNDFKGDPTIVKDGDLATVLSYRGRPVQVNSGMNWDHYDVYEILVNGNICNIFQYNTEIIPESQDAGLN